MLDFEAKRIIVAEVSTGWIKSPYIKRLEKLCDKGIPKVRQQISELNAKLADWPIAVQFFVRQAQQEEIQERLPQLEVLTLEMAFQRWAWDPKINSTNVSSS